MTKTPAKSRGVVPPQTMVDYHRHGGQQQKQQQQQQYRFRQSNFQRDKLVSRKTVQSAPPPPPTNLPSTSSAVSVSSPPLPARRQGRPPAVTSSDRCHQCDRGRDDVVPATRWRWSGRRVVLWPRGGFLFATNALSRAYNDAARRHDAAPSTVDLALRFACTHFFTHRTRRVRWNQFLAVVSGNGGSGPTATAWQWSDTFAYAVFEVARSMGADDGASCASRATDTPADLLPLCAVVAFLGCERRAARDAVNFVRQNIEKLCWLLLLANYDFARMTVCTQRFRDDYLPPRNSSVRVPLDAVENLDLLFEGTILGGGGGTGSATSAAVVASSVVPQYLSTILQTMLQRTRGPPGAGECWRSSTNAKNAADELPKTIEWDQLLRLLAGSVQADMFLLDVVDADDSPAIPVCGDGGTSTGTSLHYVRPTRRQNDASGYADVDLYDDVTVKKSGRNGGRHQTICGKAVRPGEGETSLKLKRFTTASSPAVAASGASRTITSTQLAEHRKITLRHWTHTEILTNPVYRAANLRVFVDGGGRSCGAVFHPKLLKTAAIVGECATCSSSTSSVSHNPSRELKKKSRPLATTRVVLGPVTGQLLLRNVHDATVSAVASRVCVVDCCRLTLFLNTASSILVVGRNADIRVAPYNVFYEGLAHELAAAGMELIRDERNAWRRVVRVGDVFAARMVAIRVNADDVSSVGGAAVVAVESVVVAAADGAVDESAVVRRLSAHEYYLQPTPFQTKFLGKNKIYEEVFRPSIPDEYWSAWMARAQAARRQLHTLSGAQRNELLRRAGVDARYLLKRAQRKK